MDTIGLCKKGRILVLQLSQSYYCCRLASDSIVVLASFIAFVGVELQYI